MVFSSEYAKFISLRNSAELDLLIQGTLTTEISKMLNDNYREWLGETTSSETDMAYLDHLIEVKQSIMLNSLFIHSYSIVETSVKELFEVLKLKERSAVKKKGQSKLDFLVDSIKTKIGDNLEKVESEYNFINGEYRDLRNNLTHMGRTSKKGKFKEIDEFIKYTGTLAHDLYRVDIWSKDLILKFIGHSRSFLSEIHSKSVDFMLKN